MLYTLKVAQVVALSRAKDKLLGFVNRLPEPDKSEISPAPLNHELEPYSAAIDINPLLYKTGYTKKTQDRFSDTDSPNLVADFEYSAAIYSDAFVYSDVVSHVSVYDSNRKLVDEYTSVRYIKANERLTRRPVDCVSGTTLHLCALVAGMSGNYAHWLLDLLARLILLEDRSTTPIVYDKLLIPHDVPAFRESLVSLGIDENRIVELKANQPLEFEKLLCVSAPRGYASHFTPGWLIDGYRKRLRKALENTNQPSRKLYISRVDARTRKVRQESEVIERLQEDGYESIELSNYGFHEKAELFASATHVIGLSGAGMMSIMFCSPGTNIIEMFPSNFINYQYASICSYLGQHHHPYIFPNNSLKTPLSRYSGTFDVDVDHFMNFVKEI